MVRLECHYYVLLTDSVSLKDSHLRVLQSLAAHMKLLLDTPEHLWRLLERKKYLYAGWLFLLARVIHRALVREDLEDEDDWKVHGIDVLVCSILSCFHRWPLTVCAGAISACTASVGDSRSLSSSDCIQSNIVSSRVQCLSRGPCFKSACSVLY